MVGLGGCVEAGCGVFSGVESLLELLGGHFDGETGLADEAKLGSETDRSACRAGQGEEKHLVLHSAGCRSGLQLIPEVGGPERRPRGGGAEVTGSAHDDPLKQHEELVVGERGEVVALFSMSVRANDTFEASGREEVLEVCSGVCVPGSVAGLGSSAAHLRPAVVEQAGLLGLHAKWASHPVVRTSWCGAAGAFDQFGEEQGAGFALIGLTGETKPD